MEDPSTYSIDWEDLDIDSYRSVINGDLNRNVVNRRWAKVALSWRYLTDEQIDPLLKQVNTGTLYVRMISPAFGTSNYITFKAYVSKMHVEAIEGTDGYNVSFNVIQEKHSSWQ
jgi:hypothetical protein